MCQRHQIMLKSSLHGPISRPIGHSIHLNYHQKYQGSEETTMRHNRDTICWRGIFHRKSYNTFSKNVCTNFEVLFFNESRVTPYMQQLRHNVADNNYHYEIRLIA